MQIFVMRHGQAEMVAPTDALRPLTENGVEEAKVIGQWLREKNQPFDCIFVSPYTRAQQTADALISQLSNVANRQTLKIITPEDNAKDVHDYLDAVCGAEQYQNILLVSHMPLVSYLVAELTSDHAMPIFQTASVAQIEYDMDKMLGELITLISPNDIKL
ncbi:phosphohistidine phosphatase SixA [Cognaticolwellia beringensis]|uniref:Phosphohistidine phosphatase SixA n=1 Tax=Cognaticolwellia beringensis TaxID=1967665 RepID=A0A222GDB4_9GAMM|nr:phosphohistidine phosphatase SixA [Cognaticolwellia beringensis]ASP49840.1 phosphohistidine phosphatase SixA [Cognaticolwellia beringensis]|tara:strand:- start:4276 stop:4755 length:480 start_codon:yes stop_codon:yes gene_type:complete